MFRAIVYATLATVLFSACASYKPLRVGDLGEEGERVTFSQLEGREVEVHLRDGEVFLAVFEGYEKGEVELRRFAEGSRQLEAPQRYPLDDLDHFASLRSDGGLTLLGVAVVGGVAALVLVAKEAAEGLGSLQ